ncbi:alpha/beta fold hydrolase [Aequorivita xiaoshiensis]|uniref:Alpha/beta hydrolase n=1 Tax=Aequorivita xiaoshiensis TaxID=2874476 RepID=A0A9X1QYE7_9FLAO|nr:alpha/beta hydrolase [Aequorivita xiaoshiensis]MCG2429875.1 alpha/beta hydrolase [Aequorivita xiaoshiensis]
MILKYNNTEIHYNTFGSGPAIVLLHGFLESSTMWKDLVPQLSKQFTIITLDFPGHGKSEVVSDIHSMELMAEVVDEILKTLKITSATFIGHSMGGYVALAYVEKFHSKVEKLVLLNSSPAPDSEERKINRNRALKVIEKNAYAFISMAISNLFSETTRDKIASDIAELKMEAQSFPLAGIKAAIKGMRDRNDRSDVLKNFSKEKFMILSKEDSLLPVDENVALAKSCDTLSIIIEGGHMSTVENLDEVLDALKNILNV